MNHALEEDFSVCFHGLLQGTYGNWFQHMLQSLSKITPYVPTFLTNNISALIGLGFWSRSLSLHYRFYGQGLSYTPNLCCNSKLEREGMQNPTKFTREARSSLLKWCLKHLDSERSFQKTIEMPLAFHILASWQEHFSQKGYAYY